MIYYLTLAGRTMFSEYLEHWGRELAGEQIQILRYEELLSQHLYPSATYVFSTRDEVTPLMGRFIDALALELSAWPGARVFNDPCRALQRFDLHAELWRQGRSGFQSFRAGQDLQGIRFPVFVRSEQSHDGALSPLLHSHAEVETWVGRALALGRSLSDLMVVEFCETADDGWYRKYAAFCLDGRIAPRSMNSGRAWVMKSAGNELTVSMALEELDYVRSNPHEQELREIFEIARTDYGRIDYSIKDGRVQPWEINLNPTVGRGSRPHRRDVPPEIREVREQSKAIFYSRFNEAWAVLASTSPRAESFPPLEVHVAPHVIAEARSEVRRRWRTRAVIVQAGVDLLKPLMKTAARPFLQKLYHLPRRLVQSKGGPLFRIAGRRARSKD